MLQDRKTKTYHFSIGMPLAFLSEDGLRFFAAGRPFTGMRVRPSFSMPIMLVTDWKNEHILLWQPMGSIGTVERRLKDMATMNDPFDRIVGHTKRHQALAINKRASFDSYLANGAGLMLVLNVRYKRDEPYVFDREGIEFFESDSFYQSAWDIRESLLFTRYSPSYPSFDAAIDSIGFASFGMD